MLTGTRKILGFNYKTFCEAMLDAAENEDLPCGFQVDDTFGLTCQDIADLCNEFEKDTDLDLTAHFFVCHECGKLHVMFEADYKDDDEDDDKLIQ